MRSKIVFGAVITLIAAAAMAATLGGWIEEGSTFASYDMAGGEFTLSGVVGQPSAETSSGGEWTVSGGTLTGTFEAPCAADFNGNGDVDIDDMLVIFREWDGPGADLNGDGTTGVADMLILIEFYGPCG